jgi:hypothetical protein
MGFGYPWCRHHAVNVFYQTGKCTKITCGENFSTQFSPELFMLSRQLIVSKYYFVAACNEGTRDRGSGYA